MTIMRKNKSAVMYKE